MDAGVAKAARNAGVSGKIELDDLRRIKGALTEKEYEHFSNMMKTTPGSEFEGLGIIDTITNAEKKLKEIEDAQSSYLPLLPKEMRAVAEKALETGKISKADELAINKRLMAELDAAASEGRQLPVSVNKFSETLRMEGWANPVLDHNVPDLLDATSGAFTGMERMVAKEVDESTVFTGAERLVPEAESAVTRIPTNKVDAAKFADETEAAVKNSDEYKALSAADKNTLDNTMDPKKTPLDETGRKIGVQEAVARFKEFAARNPELAKRATPAYNARKYVNEDYVPPEYVQDALRDLANNKFDDAASVFEKIDPGSTHWKGDVYFNKAESGKALDELLWARSER